MEFKDKNGVKLELGSRIRWRRSSSYNALEDGTMVGTVTKMTYKVRKRGEPIYRISVKPDGIEKSYSWKDREGNVVERSYKAGRDHTSFPSFDGNFKTVEVVVEN